MLGAYGEESWVLVLGIASLAIERFVGLSTRINSGDSDAQIKQHADEEMVLTQATDPSISSNLFARFQRIYLTAYLLMTAADWMQGPYIYAIYHQHGFSMEEIARLFITGYVSSMILGPWVGVLADIL